MPKSENHQDISNSPFLNAPATHGTRAHTSVPITVTVVGISAKKFRIYRSAVTEDNLCYRTSFSPTCARVL